MSEPGETPPTETGTTETSAAEAAAASTPYPEPALTHEHAPAPEGGDGGLAFLKDNLEAIAVAVVMALVIKHFCVEAFKIPTSSMFPTLRGEPDNPGGEGDRILVDKWAYRLGSPERWHVIVFRYPLNRSRNFIKRIAFLPNEHGHISEDGDLWVRRAGDEYSDDDLRIPQKPRKVREQFYRPVYPPPVEDDEEEDDEEEDEEDEDNPFPGNRSRVSEYWRADEGSPNAWRLESHEDFAFAGGASASLRNVTSIFEHSTADTWDSSSYAGELVRDARFQMRVRLDPTPEGEAAKPTRLTLRWRPDGEFLAVMTLHTNRARSEVFIRRGSETVAQASLPASLVAGQATDVEMEYVDGRLYAHVGGEQLVVLEDGRRFADTKDQEGEQRFQIEAEGGALHVEATRIDRDLRYENSWDANPSARRGGIAVPPKSYFMLGDNTRNSSDSRRWRLVTIHLIGGRSIRHEYAESPEYLDTEPGSNRTPKTITDADGLVRRWFEEDEDPERGSEVESSPFVHRDLIVGRAFLVFWPWTPTFPGRFGFIH